MATTGLKTKTAAKKISSTAVSVSLASLDNMLRRIVLFLSQIMTKAQIQGLFYNALERAYQEKEFAIAVAKLAKRGAKPNGVVLMLVPEAELKAKEEAKLKAKEKAKLKAKEKAELKAKEENGINSAAKDQCEYDDDEDSGSPTLRCGHHQQQSPDEHRKGQNTHLDTIVSQSFRKYCREVLHLNSAIE